MVDTLTEKITEILEPLYTDAGGYGENPYVKEVIDAIKVYNKEVIGNENILLSQASLKQLQEELL